MATRTAKRRIVVWGMLVMLAVLTALSGCRKESEPAPTEPNAATAPAADPNA